MSDEAAARLWPCRSFKSESSSVNSASLRLSKQFLILGFSLGSQVWLVLVAARAEPGFGKPAILQAVPELLAQFLIRALTDLVLTSISATNELRGQR